MDTENGNGQTGKPDELEQLRSQCNALRQEARSAYLAGSMAEWAGKTTQSHVLQRQIRLKEPAAQPA